MVIDFLMMEHPCVVVEEVVEDEEFVEVVVVVVYWYRSATTGPTDRTLVTCTLLILLSYPLSNLTLSSNLIHLTILPPLSNLTISIKSYSFSQI